MFAVHEKTDPRVRDHKCGVEASATCAYAGKYAYKKCIQYCRSYDDREYEDDGAHPDARLGGAEGVPVQPTAESAVAKTPSAKKSPMLLKI